MPSYTDLLYALPWLLLILLAPLLMLRRQRIAAFAAPSAAESPLVSVIVPARNEAVNISVCVASLLNSLYPRVEIIVVDDGSIDGTGDIVRILADHSDGRVRLIEGGPLPEGWLGKPWACWQGALQAKGELLLFTDADTRHEDTLLGHATGALQQRGADMVSLLPRQLMVTFWERLVLPHIFTILFMRYHNLARVNRTRNPRDVVANGQFILIRREAYDAVGGHEALRGEVVEDQRLAQRLVENGRRIYIGHSETLMETRMYRSLSGIIEGWSKNLALGSRQAAPAWVAPAVPWMIAAFITVAWIIPPFTLLAATLGGPGFGWSLSASTFSLGFWLLMMAVMRVPLRYAVGYPFGAVVAALLFVRSALRGSRVAWKGREYEVGRGALADPSPGI